MKYVCDVHTGSKRGAGTDANVFLNVFGLLGDTGDRPLNKSSINFNKFESGNVRIVLRCIFCSSVIKPSCRDFMLYMGVIIIVLRAQLLQI